MYVCARTRANRRAGERAGTFEAANRRLRSGQAWTRSTVEIFVCVRAGAAPARRKETHSSGLRALNMVVFRDEGTGQPALVVVAASVLGETM